MAKLIGTDGTRLYSFPLEPGKYLIGRNPTCDFCIPDKTVSRSHAELEMAPSGAEFYLTDLDSHNGTTANGRRISVRTQINPGDILMFGQAEFKITLDDKQASTMSSLPTARLADGNFEQSVFLSLHEAMKPLPKRVADIPELMPTLFEMARTLVLPEPRESMLQRSLGMVAKVIPAERLAVLFVSDNQDEVYTAATLLPEGKDPGSFSLSRTILKDLLGNKTAILIGNPSEDPRFASQQSIIMSALKSAMAVPLFDEARVLGILYVDTTNPMHRYSNEYLHLLATFGNIIASRLVNYTLLQEREERHALDMELRRASSIQKNLLTTSAPAFRGYRIHAFQKQSRSVGGDLYDVTVLPDGRLVFLVADVSGKGMGAALLMSNILAAFRILYGGSGFELGEVVRHVSTQLLRYSAPEDFATLFIGIANPDSDQISFINAGHNPPLLVRRDGTREYLQPSGTMIGAFDFSAWNVETQRLFDGDFVFIFTDGVTEAMKGDQQYSDERMERLVIEARDMEPAELARRLMADIDAFVGDAPRSDDITMLILKRDSRC
ncbi:MAG: SpoIIE family protein phosphatase [Candidatus Zixiibacteriota bacterium]